MPPKSKPVMKLVIDVPHGFECPWYETAAPEECAEALRLGATLHTTIKAMKTSEEIHTLEVTKNQEIGKIRETFSAQMAALQSQLTTTESSLAEAQRRTATLLETQRAELATSATSEKDRLVEMHKQRLNELQVELRSQQEKINHLQDRKRALESDRDSDIRIAEERTRQLLQHALDEKERAILRADKTIHLLQESFAKQTEEMRALSDLIRRKPTNVKSKGNEYEAIFREKLVAAYGIGDEFSLIDTAHLGIGHAGDYLMKWGDHTILWEVKNYDKPVPTSEVDKFKRDMKENAQVRIGVMVSRYTPITGKVASGDRTIEFVDGKMLIYLSAFETMSDDTLLNLMLLFKTWWEHDKGDEHDDSKEDAIRLIERLHGDAVRAKTEWRLHKSRMEDALRWMAERIEESESRLKNALQLLQGSCVSVDIPVGIFRDCEGDEKLIRDIQSILKHVVIEPSGSIVLNDLAELVSKDRSVSRDTAKAHIRAVLLDSAVDAQKGKSVKILGMSLKAPSGGAGGGILSYS